MTRRAVISCGDSHTHFGEEAVALLKINSFCEVQVSRMTFSANVVIGYYFNPKKLKKLSEDKIITPKPHRHVEFVPLNLETPQGVKIDVLLIKANSLIIAKETCEESARLFHNLHTFIKENPSVPVIDRLEDTESVLLRSRMHAIINKLKLCFRGISIESPRAVLRKPSDRSIPLSFPIILKPDSACGARGCHQMVIASSKRSLNEVSDIEWFMQEFINHSGVIYKVYVLGSHVEYSKRQSLPDYSDSFLQSETTVHFNSHDPICLTLFDDELSPKFSPEKSVFLQSFASGNMRKKGFSLYGNDGNDDIVTNELMSYIALRLKAELRLELFGFDVIVNSAGNSVFIVDVNYFPSYKNVQGFADKLVDLCLQKSRDAKASPLY